MSDILRRIVAAKREEVAALQRARPLADVRTEARDRPPALDFAAALRGARPRGATLPAGRGGAGNGARILAELKLRSPSKGTFAWHGDVARQVGDYTQGGAAAISVVTDGPFFGGSTELLRQVKALTPLPVLQKEFLLEPWQVHYARALGADACLLIAAILPGALLGDLLGVAREAGLHALVEVVDAEEHHRASEAGAVVIGVNNRDLTTFQVDTGRTERLLPLYRESHVCVAESGIRTRDDVEHLLVAGVDAFLIGEALMTAAHPATHLRALQGLPTPAGEAAAPAAGIPARGAAS